MTRRRLRGFAVKLLALATSVVFTLLLLEALVRITGLESASYSSISGFCRYDPYLGWNLIPENRTVFKGRHFSALVETSSQGIRDRPYPLEPEPGRERVVVLGDSVAWCWGVEIEECFTKLIEAELPSTDVITMGVPGYSTAQSVLLYERQGRQFHPDRVLLVFVGNDPVENMDGRKRPRFVVEDGELRLTNHPVPRRKSRLKEWLRGNSQLFVQLDHASHVAQELLRQWRERRAASEAERPRANPYALPTRAQRDEAWLLVEALLDRLQRGVEADGARLEIVSVDNLDSMTQRLAEFCSTGACRFLDFDPILRRAQQENRAVRLRGDPHLGPDGQRLLADAILEFLAQEPLAREAAFR